MRILIVEDDPSLGRQLEDQLTSEGYAVELATDGEEAHSSSARPNPMMRSSSISGLPKRDGLSVLRAWREEGNAVPVLVLTARDHWHDKVQGIDAGADDYLAKPFRLEELLARVRALIRRGKGHASATFACGFVMLDTRSGSVTVSGRRIELTAYEFRVLAYLMHKIGHVVSRTELTEHVYAQDFDRNSNTIEVFVGRLRRKLGRDIVRDDRRTRLPARGSSRRSEMKRPGSLRCRLLIGGAISIVVAVRDRWPCPRWPVPGPCSRPLSH